VHPELKQTAGLEYTTSPLARSDMALFHLPYPEKISEGALGLTKSNLTQMRSTRVCPVLESSPSREYLLSRPLIGPCRMLEATALVKPGSREN
jgi:hypothetical protein